MDKGGCFYGTLSLIVFSVQQATSAGRFWNQSLVGAMLLHLKYPAQRQRGRTLGTRPVGSRLASVERGGGVWSLSISLLSLSLWNCRVARLVRPPCMYNRVKGVSWPAKVFEECSCGLAGPKRRQPRHDTRCLH